MHMQGEPATMNEAPRYKHCALEIYDWLARRLEAVARAGLPGDRVLVDPGLCFGKHEPHNLDLLRHLAMFHGLGCPLLLGASRKGWTTELEEGWPAKERLPASLAAAQWGLERGVACLRVHDVAEARQALRAWHALSDSF
jgi:dihydropteroate synthase